MREEFPFRAATNTEAKCLGQTGIAFVINLLRRFLQFLSATASCSPKTAQCWLKIYSLRQGPGSSVALKRSLTGLEDFEGAASVGAARESTSLSHDEPDTSLEKSQDNTRRR